MKGRKSKYKYFCKNQNLWKFLPSNHNIKKQSKPPCHPGSGVYIIPCGECSRCYVGETGRDFSVRLREHQSYVRNGNDNSAVFNHVNSRNHSINWSGSKIVYPSNNKSDRLAVESTLIKILPNFNNSAGANIIDPLSTSIVLSSNSSILRKVPPNLLPWREFWFGRVWCDFFFSLCVFSWMENLRSVFQFFFFFFFSHFQLKFHKFSK